MTLILFDAPELLTSRLSRQGVPACCAGTQAYGAYACLPPERIGETIPPPRIWLTGHATRPAVAGSDLVLLNRPNSQIGHSLGLAWQANPFASELGLMLIVGGPADLVRQAGPVLDALAPKAGVWLHAGDVGSAHFMDQVLHALEGDVAQLALLFQQLPSSGFAQYWQQHQSRLQALASLAADYLQQAEAAPFEPAHATPAWMNLPLAGLGPGETPARRLATLLVWLGGLATFPASGMP